MRLVAERAPEGVEEPVDQFVGASGLRYDGIVARDARLVLGLKLTAYRVDFPLCCLNPVIYTSRFRHACG